MFFPPMTPPRGREIRSVSSFASSFRVVASMIVIFQKQNRRAEMLIPLYIHSKNQRDDPAAGSSALLGENRSSSQSRTAARAAAAIDNDGGPRTRSARRKKRRCEEGDDDIGRIGGDGGGDDENNKRRRTTSVQFFVKAYDRDVDGGYQDNRHFGLIEGMGGGEGQYLDSCTLTTFLARSFMSYISTADKRTHRVGSHYLRRRIITFIHKSEKRRRAWRDDICPIAVA